MKTRRDQDRYKAKDRWVQVEREQPEQQPQQQREQQLQQPSVCGAPWYAVSTIQSGCPAAAVAAAAAAIRLATHRCCHNVLRTARVLSVVRGKGAGVSRVDDYSFPLSVYELLRNWLLKLSVSELPRVHLRVVRSARREDGSECAR
jgi:hypothetical protein